MHVMEVLATPLLQIAPGCLTQLTSNLLPCPLNMTLVFFYIHYKLLEPPNFVYVVVVCNLFLLQFLLSALKSNSRTIVLLIFLFILYVTKTTMGLALT